MYVAMSFIVVLIAVTSGLSDTNSLFSLKLPLTALKCFRVNQGSDSLVLRIDHHQASFIGWIIDDC